MKRFDQVNVIPFIDIMLVLLAIVLATATFIAEGRLDIKLPAADSEPAESTPAPVQIAIDRSGTLFLDGQSIDLSELSQRLAGLSPPTPIELRVDAAAEFGAFVAVIDVLKGLGLEHLSISTRRT